MHRRHPRRLNVDEILKTVNLSRLRKATPEQVRDALNGELTDSYRCILRDIQEHIAFLQQRIEAIQARLTSTIATEHPHALRLLQSIPGVSLKGAVRILIELGGEDKSPFKTAERLSS